MTQEISEETGVATSQLRLGRDNLERAIMARLMDDELSKQWPLHYLMASYNRLSDELRSLTTVRDQAELQRMTSALIYGKQLTVSYSGLLLNLDMFPQVLILHTMNNFGARRPACMVETVITGECYRVSSWLECHKFLLIRNIHHAQNCAD